MSSRIVDTARFNALIPLLAQRGYTVIGPTVHEGVIVLDEIGSSDDLPIGWTESSEAGTYKLVERDDAAYFGFTIGPRTLKTYLFPPVQTLLTITHTETGLVFAPEPADPPQYAFVGMRACEIAAMGIQDRVFTDGAAPDAYYAKVRQRSFVVGVNCSVAAPTCFCDSMGTGPRCATGYDIVVTELIGEGRHEFVLDDGTEAGRAVIDALDASPATAAHVAQVDAIVEDTAAHMGRTFPADAAYELLTENLESPIWDSIGQRCLSCTNCTLVCPTCFCSTVDDVTDLEGTAARTRTWDSCFNLDFTNLHGHSVRSSPGSRYRQWMTHKLAYWHDQFGTSGCVGCGRCITWCPVGIDITAEIAELSELAKVAAP
jgi:sulfhydrogenase subunit beta (sulfur reductase)